MHTFSHIHIYIALNFSWVANQCDSFIFTPQTKILDSTLAHHHATPPHSCQSVNWLESLFIWWPFLPLRFLTFFFLIWNILGTNWQYVLWVTFLLFQGYYLHISWDTFCNPMSKTTPPTCCLISCEAEGVVYHQQIVSLGQQKSSPQ